MAGTGINRSDLRKIRTLTFSVAYSLSSQLTNIVLSAITVFFLSRDFWGEYSRIVLSTSFFVVLCSWGSREYLTTRHNNNFREALAGNLLSRLPLLIVSLLIISFTFRELALAAALFLVLRFINATYEILNYRERRFGIVLAGECCFVVVFLLVLVMFRQQIALHVSYFLLLMLGLEALRLIIYLFAFKPDVALKPVRFGSELKAAVPFFLNAMVGFVGSRCDSLLALFYFNNSELAIYQVAFNFVFLFQALCNFMFYTYSTHFYRLNAAVKSAIIKKYMLLGALISLLFYAILMIALNFVYNADAGPFLCLLLTLFVLASFIQQPYIYLIYQQKKVDLISVTGAVSIPVFAGLLLVMNALSPRTVFYNFVWSALLAHVFRVVVFYVAGKKYLRSTYHLSYKTPDPEEVF